MYLFITRFSTPYTAILLLSFILLAGCGQSDDQREFEREAFAAPDGFTKTTNGVDIESEDPDDWRISPFYQGLVDIEAPAYPNPVETSDQVRIENFNRDQAVTRLRTIVWFAEEGFEQDVPSGNYDNLESNSITTISINPRELSRFDNPESWVGLKRVILLDQDGNVISYGDIMVE